MNHETQYEGTKDERLYEVTFTTGTKLSLWVEESHLWLTVDKTRPILAHELLDFLTKVIRSQGAELDRGAHGQ